MSFNCVFVHTDITVTVISQITHLSLCKSHNEQSSIAILRSYLLSNVSFLNIYVPGLGICFSLSLSMDSLVFQNLVVFSKDAYKNLFFKDAF